jgi:hypothetical protein
MGATQDLTQKVLHKWGWSARYDVDPTTQRWYVEIVVGFGDTRRFVSDFHFDQGEKDNAKRGKGAASQAALDGLAELLEELESRPQQELVQCFTEPIDIYESNKENWDYFWQHRPDAVGIDTEGNAKSPPVLIQVACDDYTILEAPRQRLSNNMQKLLHDDRIIKVFCDNFAHKDKKSVGLPVDDDNNKNSDYAKGTIVDLEAIMAELMGPVNVARGLSRIVTLCMPELGVSISKPKASQGNIKGRFKNIGKFALIEQGKMPPLKDIWSLSAKEQQYAALDALCTLKAYRRLMEKRELRQSPR